MSKTIAQELTEVADWMAKEANYWYERAEYGLSDDLEHQAAKVRALAEKCKGKVLQQICTIQRSQGFGSWAAWVRPSMACLGNTPEEAIANLQALLDKGGA